MNEELEERKIELLEELNYNFNEVKSQLKTLNSLNTAILAKLEDMQNGSFNSISDICDNILDMRGDFGLDEYITLYDLKKAIDKKK